jgi:hypothetical protein
MIDLHFAVSFSNHMKEIELIIIDEVNRVLR